MGRSRRDAGSTLGAGRGSTLLVVALLVLAVVVVVVALRPRPVPVSDPTAGTPGTGAPGSGGAVPTPTASSVGQPTPGAPTGSVSTPSPSGGLTATPGGGRSQLVQAVQPPLAMLSRAVAYRALPGSCLGGSRVWRTDDGGATWRELPSPVADAMWLRARSASEVELGGNSTRCRTQVWTSSGSAWRGPAAPSDQWYRITDRPERIATPAGLARNPCEDPTRPVIQLDPLSAVEGFLLCPGGTVFRSTDGLRFAEVAPVSRAVAMDYLDADLGWLLRRDGRSCPAYVLFRTTDGGSSWVAGGCVGSKADLASAQPPSVSFVDPRRGMVTVAESTYVTADAGLTWSSPTR